MEFTDACAITIIFQKWTDSLFPMASVALPSLTDTDRTGAMFRAAESPEEEADEAIESLCETVLSQPPHMRVHCCVCLLEQPERKVRRAAIELLRSLGKGWLSASSARQLLGLLQSQSASWGARSSALEALAMHAAHDLTPHAVSVARLLRDDRWSSRAVGMQAMELLDKDGLELIAHDALRLLPALEWTLQSVSPTPSRFLCVCVCLLLSHALLKRQRLPITRYPHL